MLIGKKEMGLAAVALTLLHRKFNDADRDVKEARDLFEGLEREHVADVIMRFKMTMDMLDFMSELPNDVQQAMLQELQNSICADAPAPEQGGRVTLRNENGEEEEWQEV